MTDYLTRLPDPEEDALERALRRAENALSGAERTEYTSGRAEEEEPDRAGPGQRAEQAHPSSQWSGLPSGQLEAGHRLEAERWTEAAGRKAGELPATADLRPEAAGWSAAGGRAPWTGTEPSRSPLSGALAQADRSAARAAALADLERTHLPQEGTGVTGGGWTAPGRAWRDRGGSGGELEAAQRVDRVFRRDSRRYDGGFFLY